jgi:ferrochelatase
MAQYDAFLLVSFGGPEGPGDVMPFLANVTRGRGVPRERLAEVAHHYEAFGGVSPINQQCRDLLAAIGKDFAAAGVDLPLYWGNRNWHPFLADTVAQLAADGARHVIAFVTSAYGSYSSCRQYLDDLERARAQVGGGAPRIDKIRHYFDHPGFIGPFADAALAAIGSLPPGVRDDCPLVFTAHSVPETMAAASGPHGGLYAAQLSEAARLVASQVAAQEGRPRPWQLVYQSRSGPPAVPWLGPDVCDHLADLARAGAPGAVVVPVGSCPTTWRSVTTWTSRRPRWRAGWAWRTRARPRPARTPASFP